MKKTIYLILLQFVLSDYILAQNFTLANPTMTINDRVYKVHKVGGAIGMYNQIYYNIANGLIPHSTNPNGCVGMADIDFDKVKAKLLEVFSQQRLTSMSQNIRKNDIWMDIYVRPSTGEVIALRFRFDINTEVTRQELYLLETKIKELNFPQSAQCQLNDIMKGEAGLFYND